MVLLPEESDYLILNEVYLVYCYVFVDGYVSCIYGWYICWYTCIYFVYIVIQLEGGNSCCWISMSRLQTYIYQSESPRNPLPGMRFPWGILTSHLWALSECNGNLFYFTKILISLTQYPWANSPLLQFLIQLGDFDLFCAAVNKCFALIS